MKRVKIIKATSAGLETPVNEWLTDHQNVNILSIVSINDDSVLFLYEETENIENDMNFEIHNHNHHDYTGLSSFKPHLYAGAPVNDPTPSTYEIDGGDVILH